MVIYKFTDTLPEKGSKILAFHLDNSGGEFFLVHDIEEYVSAEGYLYNLYEHFPYDRWTLLPSDFQLYYELKNYPVKRFVQNYN